MNGALTLHDYPGDHIVIACTKCGRQGRYAKATLIQRFGRQGLPDIKDELSADCPRRGIGQYSDPCGAHYPELLARQRAQAPTPYTPRFRGGGGNDRR